jgi:hypothetical protein
MTREMMKMTEKGDGNFSPAHTGTCLKCGKRARYVNAGRGSWWVHEDSGNFLSQEPELHDVNTYIGRDHKLEGGNDSD